MGPDEIAKGKIEQRGVGAFSLCDRCNNNTGAWYATHFVAWCYQGMEILIASRGKATLSYPHYLFPLAVIKQIVTMLFTVNHVGFGRSCPELVSFVLNRERKYLPPKYRVFVYYNVEGLFRSTGFVVKGDIRGRKPILLTEMNYPPFGYVMTYNDTVPDERLIEITHFAQYDYGEFKILNLRLPVLPTHLWVPTDYRQKDEILADYEKNIRIHPPGSSLP